MCDPFTIASIAATVAGTGLQMKSQSDARKEQQSILRRNAESNRQLQDKNSAALVDARDKYGREGFDEAMQSEMDMLTQKFQDVQSDGAIPGEFGFGKRATPQIVKDFETQRRGDAKAFSNNYAQKLAGMAGFGETMFDNSISNARAGEVMDMNRSFMRGNNSVAEQQIAAAQANAGSPLGDLLSMAGGVGLSYGLSAPAKAGNAINWAPKGMTVAQATSAGIPLVPDPVRIAGMPFMGR